MKTIGETLRSVREKQGKSIDQISAQTNIKKDFLRAIEAGEFSLLPSSVAVQGFITTYAQVLSIEPKTALALLRRDYAVTRSGILPKSLEEPMRKRSVRAGNRIFALSLVFVCLATVLIYASWAYAQLAQPPALTVTVPKDGAIVGTEMVVRGRTASDATVEIDAIPVSLNQDGEFAQSESLSVGDHTITVIARNRRKQETIKQIFVHVQE